MKKVLYTSFSILFLASLSITSFAQGKSVLAIEIFNELELNLNANVIIKQGPEQRVEVSGPQELIDLLNKEVKNGTWEIEYSKKRVSNKTALDIVITVAHLKEIGLNGSGSITSETAFHEDDMEIDVNGSGTITIELYTEDLEVGINGSGNINIKGSAEKFELSINGSGDFKGEAFVVESAEIDINGSGNTEIYASKKLSATINGSGDINYGGEPDIKLSKNGSGNIKSIEK